MKCDCCGEEIEMGGRFRVTVRGHSTELRGYVAGYEDAVRLANAVKPFGWMVIASPAEDDYDPFRNWTEVAG